MTIYFEITHRDGPARIGKLVVNDVIISTPAVIDPYSLRGSGPLIDCGSVWSSGNADSIQNNCVQKDSVQKVPILAHKAVPLHTRPEIIKEFAESVRTHKNESLEPDQFSGMVVHPHGVKEIKDTAADAGLIVIGAANQLGNNAKEFVNAILEIKRTSKAGTPIYAPALATPQNLAVLTYAGIDIADSTLSIIKGYQDIYQAGFTEIRLEHLKELPCVCDMCRSTDIESLRRMLGKERAQMLTRHNIAKLEEERMTIHQQIRDGSFREYVEMRCRTQPWLTAVLRLLDHEYGYLENHTPVYRKATLYANCAESQNRVEIRRFAERIRERFTLPDDGVEVLVLLPCSAKKPYSISKSHEKFIQAIGAGRRYVHELIISSPLGIVPRELELTYPAAHYDTPVTGIWDLEERAWTGNCLADFLGKNRNRYKTIIAHVGGAYREIVESVEKASDTEFVYTANESVASQESLANLNRAVSDAVSGKMKKNQSPGLRMLRAIADFQFGKGAADLLAPDIEGIAVRAPYPKYQLFLNKVHLASLIPQYGTIALTVEGGKRIMPPGRYRVDIEDFIPRGSILAPGIADADPGIRQNDEVLIVGKRVFGVGRALMNGREMKESRRGIAVELRDLVVIRH